MSEVSFATRRRVTRLLLTAGLLAVAGVFLLPEVWLASIAMKTKAGVYEYPPRLLPPGSSFKNFIFILGSTEVPAYVANSAKVAVSATLLALVLGVPAAFVLSRERFAARRTMLLGLLVLQMVSPVVLLVPLYRIVAGIGLIDTHIGLVLVYAAVQLPFTITVLRTFFDGIPAAVLEAAHLDGASRLRILVQIAVPLVMPGLAATAIFDLVACWSEFALSLVLLDSQSKFTIPVGLFSFQSGYETEWQLVAAAALVGLLPVVAAFVALQRFFLAGLTAGAVKG